VHTDKLINQPTERLPKFHVTQPPPPHHNRFMAPFPGPPGWAGARRKLLDFMVQGKINS